MLLFVFLPRDDAALPLERPALAVAILRLLLLELRLLEDFVLEPLFEPVLFFPARLFDPLDPDLVFAMEFSCIGILMNKL